MFFTMNKKEQYEEDLLRKFINPERIEKAPEGFTSKTLARIQIEAQSPGLKKGFFFKNRLPLISAAITALFIIIAVFVPSGNTGSTGSTIWQYIRNIEITLPQISNDYLQNLNLPGWVSYAVTALFLLVVFDRALFVFFHKENNI
jgi:hypothetical protein